MKVSPSAPDADVCLLLEGTYPYVKGGVSTWVHQIIQSMPDIRFSLVYIGAEQKRIGVQKYQLPENVVDLVEVFLFDEDDHNTPVSRKISKAKLRHCHEALWYLFDKSSSETSAKEQLNEAVDAFAELAVGTSFEKFYAHPHSWSLLTKFYQERIADESFTDFFWSAKFILRPLWKLFQVTDRLPKNAVFHSVSTGYAGLLGAVAARRHSRPFILSEHGIYVRERITELLREEWKPLTNGLKRDSSRAEISALRQLWIEFFVQAGRYAYSEAAEIVALFQKNADLQAEFGAPGDRIQVIPNGVNARDFNAIARARMDERLAAPERKVVGFLGRVVAIKDVKTLLRSARIVSESIPEAHFLIAGPTDEEPGYFKECVALAESLGIANRVLFAGPMTLPEVLPKFDVMVLSSVSEGLPFSVLEAFSAGIPVVTTDVGCCQDLVEGHPNETPVIGPAGRVVPSSDSAALAESLVWLLEDRGRQDQLGYAGRARVERFYSEEGVIDAYRDLYGIRENEEPAEEAAPPEPFVEG